jgi:hypothetical protein
VPIPKMGPLEEYQVGGIAPTDDLPGTSWNKLIDMMSYVSGPKRRYDKTDLHSFRKISGEDQVESYVPFCHSTKSKCQGVYSGTGCGHLEQNEIRHSLEPVGFDPGFPI